MALPFFAATPLAVAWQLLSEGCRYYIFDHATKPICAFGSIAEFDEKLIIAAGVALWLSFVIVSGKQITLCLPLTFFRSFMDWR
jgi:hypothetical protein